MPPRRGRASERNCPFFHFGIPLVAGGVESSQRGASLCQCRCVGVAAVGVSASATATATATATAMEELQQQRTQPTASASQLPRPSGRRVEPCLFSCAHSSPSPSTAASREQSVRQLPAVVTQNVATQNGNAVTTSTTALPSSPTRSMRSLSPANNTFGSMYRLNAEAGGAPMGISVVGG